MENSKKRHYSNEIRRMAIQNYLHGKKCIESSRIFGMPQQAISFNKQVYVEENRVDQKPHGAPRDSKIDNESRTFFKNQVQEKANITPKTLGLKVFEHFEVRFSVSSIDSWLSDFHYTFKRIHVVTDRSASEEIRNHRREYAQRFQDLTLEKKRKLHLLCG